MARRPPRGFKSWSGYNRWREERGAEIGLSRGQALGHPRRGQVPASQYEREFRLVTVDGPQVVVTKGTREARVAGRRAHDQGELWRGRMTPEEFRRRWTGRTIGGEQMEGDTDRLVERLRRDAEASDLRYRRRSQPGEAA
jgi:hypothetical protein